MNISQGEIEMIKQALVKAREALAKPDGTYTKKNFSVYCSINNALFRIEQAEQTQ
jgi:hypothetical protein